MKIVIKKNLFTVIFTLVLVSADCLTAAEFISNHCPLGCPDNPKGNTMVFHHVYALSNNPTTKFASWVAYGVTPTNFGPSPQRNWQQDPLLATDTSLQPDDYNNAYTKLAVDRGHQAPLAAFAGSRYWSELNYLSNITPQKKNLNRGAWKQLEDAIQKAVSYRKPLFVITGPLFTKKMPALPSTIKLHQLPSGYFKVIYATNGKAVSFVMQQTSAMGDDFCDKQLPLTELNKLINFTLPVFTQSQEISQRLTCVP